MHSPGQEPLAKQQINRQKGSAGVGEHHKLNTKHSCGKADASLGETRGESQVRETFCTTQC